MNLRDLNLGAFRLSVPDDWEDITASLDDPEAPITVANPVSGIGALQFTAAMYEAGKLPQVGPEDLADMLDEFANNQGLGDSLNRTSDTRRIATEGADYRSGDDLIRVWFVSDGKSVLLVTYVCPWAQKDQEATPINAIVRSLRFALPPGRKRG